MWVELSSAPIVLCYPLREFPWDSPAPYLSPQLLAVVFYCVCELLLMWLFTVFYSACHLPWPLWRRCFIGSSNLQCIHLHSYTQCGSKLIVEDLAEDLTVLIWVKVQKAW